MFKVSQEIRLNTNAAVASTTASSALGQSGSVSSPEIDSIFGRYQRTPEADAYPTEPPCVYIAPELTDASKVQLLHFPNGAVRTNSTLSFILKRNGVKGNFEVRLEGPSGQQLGVRLEQLDPERSEIQCQLTSVAGLYKVHVKCNSVALPKSPYIIVAMAGAAEAEQLTSSSSKMPLFQSDASKVQSRGLGLTHISLSERNEFTVDGSQAGSNMFFVGILGPQGPCDEVVVKHLGRHVHRVVYRVCDPGDYLLVAKWGEQHIPGSPFRLSAE